MAVIKIEWGFVDDIRNILRFVLLFLENYHKFHKSLHFDASKFLRPGFIFKYLLIAMGVGTILVFIEFNLNLDSSIASYTLILGIFVPYFIFLMFFLVFYLLQLVYITIRALMSTILVYLVHKEEKK